MKKIGDTKKGIINSFIISAVLFGVVHSVHLIWTDPVDVTATIIFAIAGGILLGAIYMRTKTLIAPILLHSFLNLAGEIFTAFTSPELPAPQATFSNVIVMLIVALPLLISAFILLKKVELWEIGKQENEAT